MTEIILEPASNGVIKKVINSKYGGSNEVVETTHLYELTDDHDKFEYIKRFVFELCEDLTIDTGNKYDKEVLLIDKTWGTNYSPTKDDIDKRISQLEAEINLLKEWKEQ